MCLVYSNLFLAPCKSVASKGEDFALILTFHISYISYFTFLISHISCITHNQEMATRVHKKVNSFSRNYFPSLLDLQVQIASQIHLINVNGKSDLEHAHRWGQNTTDLSMNEYCPACGRVDTSPDCESQAPRFESRRGTYVLWQDIDRIKCATLHPGVTWVPGRMRKPMWYA